MINVGLLVLAACGAAPARPPADPCADYAAAMRPRLARLARAADEVADHMGRADDGARATRAMAAALDEERDAMGRLAPARGQLRAAHEQNLQAMLEMAGALRELAAVLESRDDGRRAGTGARLRQAADGYRRAGERVRAVCPAL